MATFVLVHGAWHGGWCWKKIVPLLRAEGHNVFTPTLTGLGERAHLLTPDVDLTTHIQDIMGTLTYEGLNDVVLVGHSYGGMVIAGVADQAGARVGHVVYLDAFLPEDGKALRDYAPGEVLDEMADARGEGWRLPSYMWATDFDVTDPSDVTWINERLGDQPYKTFTQPLVLTGHASPTAKRSYILTGAGFASHATRARQAGFASYKLLSAGHDSMVTQPLELTTLMISLV